MDVILQCREFKFDRAEAWLIPADWEVQLSEGAALPAPSQLEVGRIVQVLVERPGDYRLVCNGLSVTRISDSRQFLIQAFVATEAVRITRAAITKGSMTFETKPDGLYAVTLLDLDVQQPQSNQTVSVYLDAWRGRYPGNPPLRLGTTIQIETDASGTFLFLGRPDDLRTAEGTQIRYRSL